MENISKLKECFIKTFKEEDVLNMHYGKTILWDSVGHVTLMSHIEEDFDILLEPEDMMSLSSFGEAKRILEENYNIKFEE